MLNSTVRSPLSRTARIGASSLSWDTPATRRTWPQSGPTTAGPVSPARRKLPFRSIAARCPVASPGSQQSILDLIIGGGRHMQACANLVCCEMGLSAQPPTDTVPRTIRTMMANDRGPSGRPAKYPLRTCRSTCARTLAGNAATRWPIGLGAVEKLDQ